MTTIPREELNEMLEQIHAEMLDPTTPVCPAWCTLPAHHGWTSETSAGLGVRSHQGPTFGPHVAVEALETEGEPRLQYGTTVSIEGDAQFSTGEAEATAAHLREATSWIRAWHAGPQPWWKSHENPECVPWCSANHDDDEFTRGAGFTCARTIANTDHFRVELQHYQWGLDDQPGVISTDPAAVVVDWLVDDVLTPESAIEITAQLLVAITDAQTLANNPLGSQA